MPSVGQVEALLQLRVNPCLLPFSAAHLTPHPLEHALNTSHDRETPSETVFLGNQTLNPHTHKDKLTFIVTVSQGSTVGGTEARANEYNKVPYWLLIKQHLSSAAL